MARNLTRLQAKAELTRDLDMYLRMLPFKTHLLVISTPHSRKNRPQTVQVNKERLLAEGGEYYFIAVYYDLSYDYDQFQLIAADALRIVNAETTGSTWRIPLHLCQEEDRILEPCPFSHYLDESLELPARFTFNAADMQKAFDTRFKLYHWFAMGTAYQDTHPFNDVDLTAESGTASWGSSYAGNSPNIKVYDLLCYFYLCRFTSKASVLLEVLRGEDSLLTHKLLLRPQLADKVCETLQCEQPSLLEAWSKIREFNRKNILRIRAMDASNFSNDAIKQMAVAFLERLEQAQVEADKDDTAEAERKRLLAPPARKLEYTPKSSLCLFDIRKNAPKCMRVLMDKAFGTDEQRAKLNEVQRNALNRFLFEHKVDKEDILSVMRPKIKVAYELEEGAIAWKDIKQGIKNSEAEAEQFKEEKKQPFMLCTDLMKIGLCSHMQATPANFHAMTLIQKKASGKARFLAAKTACHADMQSKWAINSGKFVLRKNELKDWVEGPCCHTHVAIKGPKANPKPKLKDTDTKRKTTDDDEEELNVDGGEEEDDSNKRQRV